jgi:hypothetical protein
MGLSQFVTRTAISAIGAGTPAERGSRNEIVMTAVFG